MWIYLEIWNEGIIFILNYTIRDMKKEKQVIDDNVSGGATLSDICLQLKNLGIRYIIPITFGKMRTSYTQGVLKINEPENSFNF